MSGQTNINSAQKERCGQGPIDDPNWGAIGRHFAMRV